MTGEMVGRILCQGIENGGGWKPAIHFVLRKRTLEMEE